MKIGQPQNFKSSGLPLGLGLYHAACNVQVVQVLALDDHFMIGGVEGLQHHAVAALDVALQGALALVAVDQHAQIAVFQRVLLVHQRKVAILNAGLHAVAAHHQIKIVGSTSIKRSKYGFTASTLVCCSMISEIQILYGSLFSLHGKIRLL